MSFNGLKITHKDPQASVKQNTKTTTTYKVKTQLLVQLLLASGCVNELLQVAVNTS